jgi:hypothetical protein
MSLYEVSDVVPGRSFLARDLIRGGDPVRVMEVSVSKTLKTWDRIGARLIQQGTEWRMAGGVLLYDRRASDFLIVTLNDIDRQLLAELPHYAHGQDRCSRRGGNRARTCRGAEACYNGGKVQRHLARRHARTYAQSATAGIRQHRWPPNRNVHIDIPASARRERHRMRQGTGGRAGSGPGRCAGVHLGSCQGCCVGSARKTLV